MIVLFSNASPQIRQEPEMQISALNWPSHDRWEGLFHKKKTFLEIKQTKIPGSLCEPGMAGKKWIHKN
jgi:hypothetical protein